MSAVNVVATIVARKDTAADVEKILLGLIAPSRRDPGCISYDLHRSQDDPNVFVFYETWESRELLGKHLETPHLLAWREKAPNMTESMDVKVLSKLS